MLNTQLCTATTHRETQDARIIGSAVLLSDFHSESSPTAQTTASCDELQEAAICGFTLQLQYTRKYPNIHFGGEQTPVQHQYASQCASSAEKSGKMLVLTAGQTWFVRWNHSWSAVQSFCRSKKAALWRSGRVSGQFWHVLAAGWAVGSGIRLGLGLELGVGPDVRPSLNPTRKCFLARNITQYVNSLPHKKSALLTDCNRSSSIQH